MNILARIADERVADVRCDDDSLIVDLMDGRTIAVPLAWYPRLLAAPPNNDRDGNRPAAATAYTGRRSTRI